MLRIGFKTLSLRAKAIGITVAVTTIALMAVATTGVIQLHTQVAAEQQRAADSMALGFARAAELAIAVRDTRELTRLAQSFLRDDKVMFITAYGPKGEELAKAVRDADAWQEYERTRAASARCALGQQAVESGAESNEFSGDEAAADPLGASAAGTKTPAAISSGRVVIGISTGEAIAVERRQSRLMAVYTLIAGMAGAVVISLSLGSWMTRLGQLSDASKAISEGNFAISISDERQDEIGQLARSFDAMGSALRERDDKLRQFTETLQDQVKQRTKDLEAALSAAEAASRAKSLFLANMSHELRTPLNGVIGMVDLMLAAQPNAIQKRYCEVAKSSARSLLELINDILDFSKIEAGKMELEVADFNLHGVVESVVQMLGERADKKKIELACRVGTGVPRAAAGDETRLRQVLINLANNAMKFTESGAVVVEAELQSETPTHSIIRFSVRDTGIGIPPERLDRLFKSFSQVDASTTRKFGGTGLGLAISQRIVEMMGGKIGVESELGKGSTFWFTVVLEKRESVPTPNPDEACDPRGLRALIVDDSGTNREILHAQLESWSLRPDVADGATAALEMLRRAARAGTPYRFAILDMHMPDIDGVQLAQRIKNDPAIAGTILISLSSICDSLQPGMMNRLGFSAWLTKPALPSQLYNAIVDSLAATSGTAAAKPAAETLQEVAAPLLANVRVLLAEDNEVNRIVASELLMQAGCQCTIAVNGREAVNLALGGEHDVILMDCQMPELDGFEATREIRTAEARTPGSRRRPIIALTANAIKGDRELCLAAGMDDYVTKPIDPQELFRVIGSFTSGVGSVMPPPQKTVDKIKPSPDSAAPASAAPPIDLPALRQRCMGNRKIAAKALSKFDSSMTQDIAALAASVKRGDAKAAAASAHKIKGASANISAEGLRSIAVEIERLIHENEFRQTQTQLEDLEREMVRFRQYLSAALQTLGAPEATPV